MRLMHVLCRICKYTLSSSIAAIWVKLFNVSPTADLVGGKRTGVTVFLGDAFELRLSVDGQLSQGDERLHICENPFYMHYWKNV